MSNEKKNCTLEEETAARGFKQKNRSNRKSGKRNKRGYQAGNDTISNRPGYHGDGIGGNDLSWHVTDPDLLSSLANFNYDYPIGISFNDTTRAQMGPTGPITVATHAKSLPGVMTLLYANGPGATRKDGQDEVNKCATKIYLATRAENSRVADYEKADQIIAMVCVADVYKMLSWGRKMYGLISTFKFKNKYFPEAFFKSAGVDYDDWAKHYTTFVGQYNLRLSRLEQFPIIGNSPYFKRTMYVPHAVWADHNSDKAQFYTFRPEGYYVFDGRISDQGSAAIFHQFISEGDGPLTVDDYFSALDSMITALNGDQDVQVMWADTLRAFGSQKEIMPKLVEGEPAVIYYEDNYMLTAIHNATLVQSYSYDFANVTQDVETGAVIWQPHVDIYGGAPTTKWVTTHVPNPHAGDTLEATRFTVLPMDSELINSNALQYYATARLTNCGTEIITGMNVAVSPDVCMPAPTAMFYQPSSAVIGAVGGQQEAFFALSRFNYCPEIRVYIHENGMTGALECLSSFRQVDNFCILKADELLTINEVSSAGLWRPINAQVKGRLNRTDK